MMRSLLLMTVALVVLACVFAYDTSRLETIDVEEIISNKRIFISNCKCVLSEGPCTADGKQIRDTMADAIKDTCGGCSPKVKVNMAKMLKELRTNYADYCVRILKKYDATEKQLDDFVASNLPA